MRKETKKSKSSYMIIAAALLAIGGVARIIVGQSVKAPEPKKTTSSINSAITESKEDTDDTYKTDNIYDIETDDTTKNDTAKIESDDTESADKGDETLDETSSSEEKTVPAAAEVLKFSLPIKGNISKSFSLTELKYSKTYDDMRTHNGIDIIAETGTVVKSVANGKVHDIYDDLLLGKTLVIDHGDKTFSYYCGLNDVSVKKGDEVTMSKVIGTVGEVPSECMDAPHLHFMIKKDDKFVEPLKLMGLE